MAYQSGANIAVNFKQETNFGELAGATGATALRVNTGSGGLSLTKAPITSNENRRDGMTTRGRGGSRSVAGSYPLDLSLGSCDIPIEATLRGTFDVGLTITETDFTSITTTANTIVGASGSWIDKGLRVGDVVHLVNHATAANNGKNLPVLGLTANTITVPPGSLEVNATPDTAVSIVRSKKVIQAKVARSFSVEEAELDIGGSEIFVGCRFSQMQIQMQPNGMVVITFSMVGRDMDTKEGVNSPYFTDPEEFSSVGMTAAEAFIYLGNDRQLDVTSLDLTFDLRAAGTDVSGSQVTPEVFTNNAQMSGSVTTLRKDLDAVRSFLDEEQVSLHLVFVENDSASLDFSAFFVGNVTLGTPSKSAIGQDGGRTQQLPLNIGADDRGGAYARTMMSYQTTSVA